LACVKETIGIGFSDIMIQQMLSFLQIVVYALVLAMPGVLLISWIAPEKSTVWRWTHGLSLGLALTVYLAFVSCYFDLRWFYPVWAALLAASIVLYRRSSTPRLFGTAHGDLRWLAVVLGLVAASRMGVAMLHEFPMGWDPSFHCILSMKILTSNHLIRDWRPLEAITLNYPLGSHVLVAVLAQMARVEPHTAFNPLIPTLGVIATAQVFLLGWAATGNQRIGLLSATAYGLWAVYGSIDYYRWGGLPNLLGMVFLVSILNLLLERSGRKLWPVSCILMAGLILSHHHVMLVAFAILLTLMMISIIPATGCRLFADVSVSLLGGVALSAFHTVPYFLKVTEVASTSVLKFEEENFNVFSIPQSWGLLFTVAVILGAILYIRDHRRTKWKQIRITIDAVLPWAIAVLFLLYIVCGEVYPRIAQIIYGRSFGAFTPSRFVTDMVCLCSVFAGYALFRISPRTDRISAWLVLLAVAGSFTILPNWLNLRQPDRPSYVAACRWIKDHTSPDTYVLDSIGYQWTSYLSWRWSTSMPIPTSEPMVPPEVREKRSTYLRAVFEGKVPPDAPGPGVVLILPSGKASPSRVLWQQAHGYSIEQLKTSSLKN
jgi:hypothetical protein